MSATGSNYIFYAEKKISFGFHFALNTWMPLDILQKKLDRGILHITLNSAKNLKITVSSVCKKLFVL